MLPEKRKHPGACGSKGFAISIDSLDGTLSLTTGASGFAAAFLGLPLGLGAGALLPLRALLVLRCSVIHRCIFINYEMGLSMSEGLWVAQRPNNCDVCNGSLP